MHQYRLEEICKRSSVQKVTFTIFHTYNINVKCVIWWPIRNYVKMKPSLSLKNSGHLVSWWNACIIFFFYLESEFKWPSAFSSSLSDSCQEVVFRSRGFGSRGFSLYLSVAADNYNRLTSLAYNS